MSREFEFEAALSDWVASRLATIFTERFSGPTLKKLDIARIIAGFYSMWVTSGKKFDSRNFSIIREAAVKSGKITQGEVYELLTTLPDGGYGEFLPIDEIGKKAQSLKEKGLDVGLKFGHYRRLTPVQILELAAVRRCCDHLILIIESGERTTKFKGRRLELTDDQRKNMFINSCLVNTLGMTEGLNYSNEYYRSIVTTIRPTTLFIAESWPSEVQEEYKKRAELCGAEPFVVPEMWKGMTTSFLEPLIFSVSK